ncbi:MAG: putative oxidoreductase [Alphaproteobacteria bacterium]|nr:putative oxidoreductase [Alphaproteobacteria bacterium]
MASTTDFVGRTSPGSGSIVALIVAKLVALCAAVPYALVAVGLRFVMARVFFLDGQSKIDGPAIPLSWIGRDFNVSVILPVEIKDATFQLFQTQYAALPMPPTVAAYLFSYAEFVLPVCLLLGFATRFAALGLIAMTALLTIYVMPEALWPTHVYWFAILMVLMSVGPGAISIDAAIRYVYERQ